MNKKKERRCHECGIGKVRKVAKKGRIGSFKNLHHLPLPSTLEIPTCSHCGTEWIDLATAKTIDTALEKLYRTELRKRIKTSIEVISNQIPQQRLESLLGLSQGYLSKLRSGVRDPSPELVSNLALIANDPVKRVRELEKCWRAA